MKKILIIIVLVLVASCRPIYITVECKHKDSQPYIEQPYYYWGGNPNNPLIIPDGLTLPGSQFLYGTVNTDSILFVK